MSVNERVRDYNLLLTEYEIDESESLAVDSFDSVVAMYQLPASHAKCQLLKQDKNCGQEHLHGFVLRSKSGKNVLVGNHCASKKLGVEDAGINKKLVDYRRKVEQLERRQAVEAFLEEVQDYEQEVRFCLTSIRKGEDVIAAFTNELPEDITELLITKARTGNSRVQWEAIKRKFDEATGTQELIRTPQTIGLLKGLSCWWRPEIERQKLQLRVLRNEFKELQSGKAIKSSDLEKLEGIKQRAEGLRHVRAEVEKFSRELGLFCAEDNLHLLYHMVRNRAVRKQTLLAVFAWLGQELTTSADTILSQAEQSFMAKFNSEVPRILMD